MSLYRGAGGASDATDDSTVNAVAGYASSAASSATSAANSAVTASNSATAAASSASAAASSASSVSSNATNAANSAALAGDYASLASISKDDAAASATTAATKAGEASTSASNAATSASAATTKSNEAASSAADSAASASNAATSASDAAASASSALAIYGNTTLMNNAVASAATSASNAAVSASNANDSRILAEAAVTGASSYASAAQSSANSAAASASSALAIYGNTSAMNQAVQTSTTNAAQAVTSANAAAASASSAATSASTATTQAAAAAASAASASAVVLGNEPVRPSVRPSLLLDFANTKQLDPRITFTRAATATYYDGKTTAMAEQNLLTYSQDFDNAAWTKGNATVTANAIAAPDGTATADLITENTATNSHYVSRSSAQYSAGSVVTVSVYVKANGRTFFGMGVDNSQTSTCFNLTTGTVGTKTSIANTSTITDVGGGWWRCTMSWTSTLVGGLYFVLMNADGNTFSTSYTGDGTSGVYIWGAQVEQRSSVTAYTPTTTAAITNYIPALQTAASGAARFDHAPAANPTTNVSAGESLGLLIEEQRTNLLTYSDQFDNAVWLKLRASITANSIIAPDGTLTGDKLVEDTTASNTHWAGSYGSQTVTSGTTYTFSAYVKAGERGYVTLVGDVSAARLGAYGVQFSLSDGSVTRNVGSLTTTSVNVGNGWWRFSITATAVSTGTCYPSLTIGSQVAAGSNGQDVYTGNGYSGIYIWGAQMEAGSFPTSYIPTTTAQVTRAADAASMTGTNFSSWYRADEGTLVDHSYYVATSPTGTAYLTSVGDGSVSNIISINSSSGASYFRVRANSADQVDIASGGALTGSFSRVIAYKTNDFAVCANGGTVVADTSGNVPLNLTGFSFGSSFLTRCVKKIAYYPLRLPNATLQDMTTV